MARRDKTLGVALILMVGLLNYHLPHFLLERTAPAVDAPYVELIFLANLVGAVIAGVAIWRDRRWGWQLGLLVVSVSFVLYLAQETVGLPGLPNNWWEPSRVVALIIEASFVVLAWRRFGSANGRGA